MSPTAASLSPTSFILAASQKNVDNQDLEYNNNNNKKRSRSFSLMQPTLLLQHLIILLIFVGILNLKNGTDLERLKSL